MVRVQKQGLRNLNAIVYLIEVIVHLRSRFSLPNRVYGSCPIRKFKNGTPMGLRPDVASVADWIGT